MAYNHTETTTAIADLNARFRPLEALEVAKDAYQENPELWQAFETYITCLQALGRTPEADALLDKAETQFGDMFQLYLMRYKACLDAHDFAGCEDNLERPCTRTEADQLSKKARFARTQTRRRLHGN